MIGCKILDFLAQMMEQIDDKFHVKKKEKGLASVELYSCTECLSRKKHCFMSHILYKYMIIIK